MGYPIFALLLALLAFPPGADAASCKTQRQLEGSSGKMRLCYLPQVGDYVSFGCMSGSCAALRRARLTARKPVVLNQKELAGGSHPESVACAKAGGQVLILRDSDGDESSYCQFRHDGSIAGVGLFHWVERN